MNKNVLALAIRKHDGQTRKFSGEPYIVHPIEVAFKVAEYWYNSWPKNFVENQINAALLHDTLEDTDITEQEIIDVAGEDVLTLVRELTNPSKGSTLSRPERKQMDRDHIKGVSRKAKIIKLIDRTCNLMDMVGAEDDFKCKYIRESRLLFIECLSEVDIDLEKEYLRAIDYLDRTLPLPT